MPSSPIASVLASTLENSQRNLMLASVKSNAFMAWAFSNKLVEKESGGKSISNPLITGRNPNVTSYQYYDPLPLAQTNEFTKVEANWSRVAGNVIISRQEEDENKGETAIFKIVKGKIMVLEESIKEKFSEYLYGTGAGTDPYGLPALIPDDPTAGSIGGLSRVTQPQWRTSSYAFAGALDETNIEEAFDDILMDLKLKGDKPDLILVGRNINRLYRTAIRDKVVINISDTGNGKKMFDLGFEGFTHNGIAVIYDEDCPDDKAYFINSKYIRHHILNGVNMRVDELVAPWNIDGFGRRVVWQGQFMIWNAYRKHAVLTN